MGKEKKVDYTKDFYIPTSLGKWLSPDLEEYEKQEQLTVWKEEMKYLLKQDEYYKEEVWKKENEYSTLLEDIERRKYFEDLFTKKEMES